MSNSAAFAALVDCERDGWDILPHDCYVTDEGEDAARKTATFAGAGAVSVVGAVSLAFTIVNATYLADWSRPPGYALWIGTVTSGLLMTASTLLAVLASRNRAIFGGVAVLGSAHVAVSVASFLAPRPEAERRVDPRWDERVKEEDEDVQKPVFIPRSSWSVAPNLIPTADGDIAPGVGLVGRF